VLVRVHGASSSIPSNQSKSIPTVCFTTLELSFFARFDCPCPSRAAFDRPFQSQRFSPTNVSALPFDPCSLVFPLTSKTALPTCLSLSPFSLLSLQPSQSPPASHELFSLSTQTFPLPYKLLLTQLHWLLSFSMKSSSN